MPRANDFSSVRFFFSVAGAPRPRAPRRDPFGRHYHRPGRPRSLADGRRPRCRHARHFREAFADRRYEADGSLTPRKVTCSTLTIDEAARQAALLASDGVVIARDSSRVLIAFDTLCIHADRQGALERLRAVRVNL
jgi:hypothetical protein